MDDFHPLPLSHGLVLELSASLRVQGWHDAALPLSPNATHFGMATVGRGTVTDQHGTLPLSTGMFFVVDGAATVAPSSHDGSGLVISTANYHGLRQCGGPIESAGRLRYIDGCSDTLLVCPPRLGEPCLNHLHLPRNTAQSRHTHPSPRIGVIVRGSGECRTPSGTWPLTSGMGWYIPTDCPHSFFTADDTLDVLAWHPDSDFGPEDCHHPMINRTILPNLQNIQNPQSQ